MKLIRWTAAVLTSASALASMGSTAWASSPIEFPDNGVAQFSRGGAWLATATDPIAGYYNPAALSTQPTSLGVGANLAFQKICYTRKGPGGSLSSYHPGGPQYPTVCNSNSGKPNVIPNLAFTFRATKELGIGLTITPPASYGTLTWPDTAPTRQPTGLTIDAPAAQRYLSMGVNGTILLPTLAAGYSVTDKLHVGAGFVAGIAILELKSMSMGTVTPTDATQGDATTNDTLSTLKVKDLFVPGFVASGLYEVSDNVDVAGWYHWSDKIHAKGDLNLLAIYYDNTRNYTRRPNPPETNASNVADVTIAVPMEARIGARWHMPRKHVTDLEREGFRRDKYPSRDPLRDDLYDVELDFSWSNNSSGDITQVRFTPGIAVNGTGGNLVPTNADRPTGYKDTFGARLGGQYNLLVNKLGLRLGTWVETSANDAAYLTATGVPAFRGGFGGGLVFRVAMVDIEAGYQHHWNAGFDNGGNGVLTAIAATGNAPANRSYNTVNGGKITQSANVFALGGVMRF